MTILVKQAVDTCNVVRYTVVMIKTFRHKGLEKFFLTGSKAGIKPEHAKRLSLILARLHASTMINDMNLPGLRLHQLVGNMVGFWAVDVSGNWRVIFRFEGQDVLDVDYDDYH
jgi:proteic killer suppression protein